jgi:hypothetical protein
MQPTYLPWAGYFAMMAQVEHFVLLDDVQFERRSWQSRNRILLNGAASWLTVPVRGAPRETPIGAIRIDDTQRWRDKHMGSLAQSYSRSEYWPELTRLLEPVASGEDSLLSDLNGRLIRNIHGYLGLECRLHRASELACGGRRGEHLAQICRHLGCERYLSAPGSRDYLHEDAFAACSGLQLDFLDFEPPPYTQPGTREFISHLSIVDVIAALGQAGCREYIGL